MTLMLWHCYLRRRKVYLPTMGIVSNGLYRGTDPVEVVPIDDAVALREAVRETLARGNPPLSSIPRYEQPPPVLLKYTDVKTWSAFERGTVLWRMEHNDGTFRIMTMRKSADRGWNEDRNAVETLPGGSTIDDVAERMVSILQDAVRGDSAR